MAKAVPLVAPSAELPGIVPGTLNLHAGILLQLGSAALVWWLIERSRFGFQVRALGANPHAARTAGMRVGRLQVTITFLSGGPEPAPRACP
ncbi:ABC transporter permease [Sinosporangium siamense]|uniref:Uncharacterized protein n=1 Tax=Sinosporangium siamense TaxID=1367973 RepID=A0A919RI71_9ACTN|nr:ABC transporter permease [Sinosporangium siamense]GII94341.1 hypothetical protein Ssi02_45720 [Sinosporangium siamense]